MRSRSEIPLAMLLGVFLLSFITGGVHGRQDFSGLPPGPYCAARYPAGNCCDGRQDDCSAPILTTTCYCDDFCDRSTGDDCCPDYWSHCRGIKPTTTEAPPGLIISCNYKNEYRSEGTFKDNCNTCKCSAVRGRANVSSEVTCEQNRCLVNEQLIKDVNFESPLLGWRAENHSEFWGRTLDEGIQLRLGTLDPARSIYGMKPLRPYYAPDALPNTFDSQIRWPDKIAGISDQGWCGASWALSTVDVASDRHAIMSKGRETVQLSAQHLISCDQRGQQGCKGGHLDKAWQFVRKHGLVDDQCYPWIGETGKCRLRKKVNLIQAGCHIPEGSLRTEPYKVGPAYRLGNETDIMQEIVKSGPVQATMKVYQDFFVYKSGVYKHSPMVERLPTGYHSVRITGWGEESTNYGPVKYWTVANTWGPNWGEGGYFRIVRGTNECEIEEYILAAWAKVLEI